MKLYLYHVSQSVNNDYDTYSDFVCAAESEGDAKIMHPDGGIISQDAYFTWVGSPSDVSVRLIGTAAHDVERGVICASFHAG